MSEAENKSRLQAARANADRNAGPKKGEAGRTRPVLSFREKLSKHWMLLVLAFFFDALGLIPYIGVIFNVGFAMLLGLISSGWKEKEKPNPMDIIATFVVGSAIDLILAGLLPVNLFAAVRRIGRSQETE